MTGIYIIINPKGLAYIGQSININNSSREVAECFGINKNTLRGKLNGTRTNNTNLIYI
jgi:intein-encoded DNA endonuclease-like protein